MKSLQQVKEIVDGWKKGDSIGSLLIHKYPNTEELGIIEERVVKAREMPEEVQAALALLMDHYSIERGEMFRNAGGKPDRIKYTRRIS